MGFLEFLCGILDLAHLVVAKREIEPGLGEGRRLTEGDLVFGDGLLKTAQTGKCGAQVGMDCSCLGMHLEELPVLRHRALKVAGPLPLLRILHQFLRVLRMERGRRAEGQHGEEYRDE